MVFTVDLTPQPSEVQVHQVHFSFSVKWDNTCDGSAEGNPMRACWRVLKRSLVIDSVNVKHSVKQCKYTTALQMSLLVLLYQHAVCSFYFLQSDILTPLMFAEDEQQQKTLSCSKSVRQLTIERDQAIADLNSVERSFADLFRRYENMKGVLEGFKKVGRASVWLSWDASAPTTT